MSEDGDGRQITRRNVLRTTGAGAAGATVGLGAVETTAAMPVDSERNEEGEFAFSSQKYIDTRRSGGEPTVDMHPDGTLLYSAHAGTTLLDRTEVVDIDSTAYVQNYTGQAYFWWSDDLGETWNFVDRTVPPEGVPGSGFSDPEYAVDMAGNVYISEMNLVNVAVSKSYDSGRSYELQNLFGQVMEDRPWMGADERNVLYMAGFAQGGGSFPNDPAGHRGMHLWKSKDGGETFVNAAKMTNPGAIGELEVDKNTGTVYQVHSVQTDCPGNPHCIRKLIMGAFRGARQDDFSRELNTIVEGVDIFSVWPSIDIDPEGNLYITWTEGSDSERPAGIYFASSTDGGRTWSTPVRVDGSSKTDIWSWITVGDKGRVAISWLRASKKLPDHDPGTSGDYVWRVMAAGTLNGHKRNPSFERTIATESHVHEGSICMGGTNCVVEGKDRRMGDFFTLDIDNTGRVWIGYPDTRQGGVVSLPGFVRQTDGPRFLIR